MQKNVSGCGYETVNTLILSEHPFVLIYFNELLKMNEICSDMSSILKVKSTLFEQTNELKIARP